MHQTNTLCTRLACSLTIYHKAYKRSERKGRTWLSSMPVRKEHAIPAGLAAVGVAVICGGGMNGGTIEVRSHNAVLGFV